MRRQRRRLAAVLAAVVLVASAAGAMVVQGAHRADIRPAAGADGLLVVLLIGSDKGPPHRPGDPLSGLADAIHLVAVDPVQRRATIVDIPRDGLVGGRKANAHLAAGGPLRLRDQLQAATGLAIDHWALTTFHGLEQLVDGLGGLDIVVDVPMRDPFSGSDFPAGPMRMDGRQALAFTRDRRSVAGGDLGRTRHQGDLLRAVHAQVRARQSDLPTLVRLAALLGRSTVSDIPADQLLPLAFLAVSIDPADVLQVPLGGAVGTVAGASVVHLAAGATFSRIAAGQVGP